MGELSVCRCCNSPVSTAAVNCPRCGEPNPAIDLGEMNVAARTLISQGKKIDAIKLVRELTGWGLKEAKDYVESL